MNILDIAKQIHVFADQLESQNALESEKPDPHAELKKAHAEGKVIQVRVSEEVWEERDTLVWDSPPECYRIKPTPTFQLPPPPPGMQWHRTDGWQEGDLPRGWGPLGPEDVPPGSVFRAKSWNEYEWMIAARVIDTGVYLENCATHQTWGYLRDEWQINRSIPLTGKWNPDAWEPCHKEIDA